MKLRIILLSLLSLCFFSSCRHTDIKELVKQLAEQESDTTGYTKAAKHLMPFHAVVVDCFADVTYTQTSDESRVEIMAPPQSLQYVESVVRNGRLEIGINRRHTLPREAVIVVKVFAPSVSVFTLNGGKCLRLGKVNSAVPMLINVCGIGAVTCRELKAPSIDLEVEGAGNMDLQGIDTQQLEASINGAGNIILAGKAATRTVEVQGVGHIDTTNLTK
ncbi:MAG: GIN domain-containing protein [Alloprevotella sp.]